MEDKTMNDTERFSATLSMGHLTIHDYPELVIAMADVKAACAEANEELKLISKEQADAIIQATNDMATDLTHIPAISMSRILGVPLNALVNDFLAEKSGVDVAILNLNQEAPAVTTAVRSLCVTRLFIQLTERARIFAADLEKKAIEFRDVVTVGRVGMRDSVPISIGAQFHAWSAGVRRNVERVETETAHWRTVSLGASQLGTGAGITPEFGHLATKKLAERTHLSLQEAEEQMDCISAHDALLLAHAHIQSLAAVIWRCTKDLCLMCSGPRCGLGEITFPAVAPGSSIMPGKINPTVGQMVKHVCDQINSNQTAMMGAVNTGWLGNGSVSTLPLKMVIDDAKLLTNTMELFNRKVLIGITAHPEHSAHFAEQSLTLARVLIPKFGIKVAQQVALWAQVNNTSVKDAAVELKVLSKDKADRIFNLSNLIRC